MRVADTGVSGPFVVLSRRVLRSSGAMAALWLGLMMALTGCGALSTTGSGPVSLHMQGKVQGGQQPVTGALLQLYAVGTTGDGSAAAPLIAATLTTSDGTGNPTNSNANAGNNLNSLPSGAFTLTGTYTCPTPSSQVYLVATGGNPGLPPGRNNPALAMMAALGACGNLSASTNVQINELTTVGSIAPLAPFMNGYASLGSGTSDAAQLTAAMDKVRQYTNTSTGTLPGPELPPGYYASSLEVQTLGDILAGCVNSDGTGPACTQLFALTTPPGGTAPADSPTDTIGAAINIVKYPAHNTADIYNLLAAGSPFQPTLPYPPSTWATPILAPTPTPVISPAAGSYSVAPTVTITDTAQGATIRYTTDGSAPTGNSAVYTAPFTLSGPGTVKAIATSSGYTTSAIASAQYTLPASGTATQLVFIAQPGNAAANANIPNVRVTVADAYGTPVAIAGVSVTVALGSNPSAAVLSGTRTKVTGADGSATFSDLKVSLAGNGYTLAATANGYSAAASNVFNVYPYAVTLAQPVQTLGAGKFTYGTATLGTPAPVGGLTVNLSVADTTIATVNPATLTIPEGSTSGTYTITSVGVGSTTLTGSASGYADGTYTERVSASYAQFGTLPTLSANASGQVAVTLNAPAPAGGLTVLLSTSNSASAFFTPSSLTFNAGSTTATTVPTLNTRAYGDVYLSATSSGTVFGGESRLLNTGTNSATLTSPVSISSAQTTATVTLTLASPAPANGLTFTLSSDATNIATVTSSVFVAAGATAATFSVNGVGTGTTTVRAKYAGLPDATSAVTVAGSIYLTSNLITGTNMYAFSDVGVSRVPGVATSYTVTSSDPNVLVLARDATGAGAGASVTFSNITTPPTYYFFGKNAGSVTLTVTSPAFASPSSVTVPVQPVGVIFDPTSYSTNTATSTQPLTARLTLVNGSGSIIGYAGGAAIPHYTIFVSPGATFGVTAISSAPAVGTVSDSPFTFAAGSQTATLPFTPVGAGTANVTLTPSSGFPAGSATSQASVTVVQPTFTITNNSDNTGAGVYFAKAGRLTQTATSAVNVTVTSNNPAIAVVSANASAMGGASVVFSGVTLNIPNVYVQALAVGTTTLTYSAPGYQSFTTTLSVMPAGIIFEGSSTAYSTTTVSAPSAVKLKIAVFSNAGAYSFFDCSTFCFLNPAGSVTIPVNMSNPSIGSFSAATFAPGTSSVNLTFTPTTTPGTSTLTLGAQTAPFSNTTTTGYLQASITVTAATFTLGSATTGATLYVTSTPTLSRTPNSPTTLTVTSSNPSVALISKSAAATGSDTLTYASFQAAGFTYYIQGQQPGTSTITLSAPGFTTSTATATVLPSGVVFTNGTTTYGTTAFSGTTTLNLGVALLNATTLQVQSYASSGGLLPNPGVSYSIPVISSNTGVGTISSSPVTFAANAVTGSTNFVPYDLGSTIISLGTQPTGLSAAATASVNSVNFKVTGEQFNVTSTLIGEGLYTYKFVTLPATPSSYPVTVTLTLDDPVGKLSIVESAMGASNTLVLNISSNSSFPTLYIQGTTAGKTNLTVSARGYATGKGSVQVMKTGVTMGTVGLVGAYGNTSTSTTNATASGQISLLDPSSLAYIGECTSLSGFVCTPNPGHDLSVIFATTDSGVATLPSTPSVIDPAVNLVFATFTITGSGFTNYGVLQQPAGWYNTTTPWKSTGRLAVNNALHMVSREVDTSVGFQVQSAYTLSGTTVGYQNLVGTATVADTSIAVLSKSFSTAGSASISNTGLDNLGATFYVQGLREGTTTITITAQGYVDRVVAVRVHKAGFALRGTDIFRKLSSGFITASVTPAVLNDSLQWIGDAVMNPGVNASVPVSSSSPAVGTVASPVAVNGATSGGSLTFTPVAVGSTVLTLGAPSGYSMPVTYQSINATVQ